MAHPLSARLAVLATLALGLTTVAGAPAGASDPDPAKPLEVSSSRLTKLPVPVSNPIPLRKGQRAAWFVQFEGTGAADAAERSGTTAGKARVSQVKDLSGDVLARARTADGGAAPIFTITNAMAGAGLLLDQAGVAAVAKDPDVVKVSRIVPKTTGNANAAQLVKALKTWKFSGNTGQGVTVGVIDTGLDYTHADFGGKGTVAAYDAAKAAGTSPTWRQSFSKRAKAKVVGGYDFAGDAYDSAGSDPAVIVPKPDNNPLDCEGHGTHVAGTAAGYGVTAEGKTLKPKKLTKLTKQKLQKMIVGPGMAPQAELYALRVFGCEGSTDLVMPALDKALDPNGDGEFDDKLDIVNMSLGSDYGPVDDPENDLLDAITAHGVLSVVSIGNGDDLTDIGGSPGNATSTLAVASSVDSYQLRDAVKVNGPAAVAGTAPGQASAAYDWKNNGPTKAPVTGTVVALSAANADGCTAYSPADKAAVAGKIAWVTWDSNSETRACGSAAKGANARTAGAIGVLFTGDVDPFAGGITGDATIPVFQLTPAATAKLGPQVASGQLSVTFDGTLLRTLPEYDNGLTDTISSFTSRGTHGSLGVVKPDVAAVGDSVASAGVGTGDQALVESGTSMAAPTTAGVAALVKAAHPKWSPLKVKTAIMNTARHDLYTGKGKTGLRYGPARVGAGRIDAKAAVTTKLLAYVGGADNPVSASFGVVPAPINGGPVTRTREVTIRNLGQRDQKVGVSYEGLVSSPGVAYSVSPSTVKVKAKRKAKVTVTMTVTPTALRHTIDPTMKVKQLDTPRQFVSDASGRLLVKPKGKAPSRVPVYGAAKPTSATTSAISGANLVTTGTGIASGATASDYNSALSVLQLGATSPQLPTCTGGDFADGCVLTGTDRSMDLQYVGAGTNGGADGLVWFGISTYQDWVQLGAQGLVGADVSTTGDADPEFEIVVQSVPGTDLVYATTYKLNDLADPDDDETVDLQPLNFKDGDFDTNVFDTNVAVFGATRDALGLPATGPAPITYTVFTQGYYSALDETDPIAFNAGTTGTPSLGTSNPLFADQGGTSIPLTGTGTLQALVLHLHGAAGQRAQVLNRP